MSGMIRVKYDEVSREAAGTIATLLAGMDTMRNGYASIQSKLESVDGSTNAALKEAMESNKTKTETIELTIHKLIVFMRKSAINIEAEEHALSSRFVYRM